jgi:hypothetical protein
MAGGFLTGIPFIWWPYYLTCRIFYFPIFLVMYIIVDCFGDKKWVDASTWKMLPLPKRIMVWKAAKRSALQKSDDKNEDWILYLSEFRKCLYEFGDFGWKSSSGSSSSKCKSCRIEGCIWCVDCNKRFCAQCAYNQHAPDSSANRHSLEKFVEKTTPEAQAQVKARRASKQSQPEEPMQDERGVALFTPILAEALCLGLLLYAVFGSHPHFIEKTYMTSQVACPLVSKARGLLATVDASLFHHFKSTLFEWCEMEDSFVRFILDAWVRTIVSGTDSTVLVFQTLWQAMLVDLVLTYTVVPIFAVGYALVFQILLWFESRLPASLRWLEHYVDYLNLFDHLGLGDYRSLPPETENRMRGDQDVLDWFKYWRNKKLRYFRYYYQDTRSNLTSLVWLVLKVVLCFRLGCLWCGHLGLDLANPVRYLCSIILPGPFKQHEQWFGSAWNKLIPEERLGQFARAAFRVSFSALPSVFAAGQMLLTWRSFATMFALWFIIAYCGFGVLAMVCANMVKTRRKFDKHWEEKGKNLPELGQKKDLQSKAVAEMAVSK